jgi:hypothetical protein
MALPPEHTVEAFERIADFSVSLFREVEASRSITVARLL